MPCGINDPFDIFQSRFTRQSQRIDGVFDGVTQTGHFIEFSLCVESLGRTDLGAGRAVWWAGIGRQHRVRFNDGIRHHGAQTQKPAVFRMIGLATAPETSQAGVDRRGIMGTVLLIDGEIFILPFYAAFRVFPDRTCN